MSAVKKQRRYRSKHDPNLVPTGTTFGPTATARIGIANCGGRSDWVATTSHKQSGCLYGPKEKSVMKPDMYLRKGTGSIVKTQLNSTFQPDRTVLKPAVPKREETCKEHLQMREKTQTEKNFILINTLESILGKNTKPNTTKTMQEQLLGSSKVGSDLSFTQVGYLGGHNTQELDKHNEFGKVPAYLDDIKKQISIEKKLEEEIEEERIDAIRRQKPYVRMLPESDRVKILNDLIKKQSDINKEYQLITHHVYQDTLSKRRRKELFETQLAQLERDIEQMSKKYVFIQYAPEEKS